MDVMAEFAYSIKAEVFLKTTKSTEMPKPAFLSRRKAIPFSETIAFLKDELLGLKLQTERLLLSTITSFITTNSEDYAWLLMLIRF
jgi:hypothetical protein